MEVTHKITIHLDYDHFPATIHAVQGDTVRVLEVSLYSGSTTWTVPTGATVLVRYRKPDGTGGVYDTLPDGAQAWSVSGNVVTVALAPQALAVGGLVKLQVALVLDEEVISTFTINLRVQPDPSLGAVVSEDYFNLRQWVAEEVERLGVSSCYVTVTVSADGTCTADKTYAELQEAYNAGKALYCLYNGWMLPLCGIDDELCSFAGVYRKVSYSVSIYADEVKIETVLLAGNSSIPTALPNPNKLILTGAVEAEYDGSGEVTVEIPDSPGVYVGTEEPTDPDVDVWIDPDDEETALLAEYTHEANLVIQPTAFDAETGYFTCVGHGISTLDPFIYGGCIILMNDDKAFDATVVPGGYHSCQLRSVDDDTFFIDGWDFANDGNIGTIDVAAFHFESPVLFSVSGIPVRDRMRVEICGKLICTSWLTFTCSLLNDEKIYIVDRSDFVSWGRPGYGFGAADGVFHLQSDIVITGEEIQAKGTIIYTDSNKENPFFQNFLGRYTIPEDTGTFEIRVAMDGDVKQGVANGTTVKVWALD